LKSNSVYREIESTRQIKYGAIMSYISIAVNIIAGFFYTPWIVRQIGQNNFGIYTLATSIISMFLIDFGLSAAVSRFVSKYNAEGDQESVNNVLGIVYRIYIIIDTIILIALIIIYFNLELIYRELTPDELMKFKVVYIIASVFSIFSFPFISLNGILASYERFIELKMCDLLHKVTSVLLIIIALINGYGLYALVTANAVSGVVTILVKIIIIKWKTPVKVNIKYKSKIMMNEILSFSVWSTVISIAQRFIFNIAPSILGALSGTVNISIFGIASSLEGHVYLIANGINGLFLPKVTRLVNRENTSDSLLQLMIKVGRIQLAIIGLILIGFIILGKEFILLWLGESYVLSYYCALLLILPSIVYLPQQIGNTAIVALDKVRLQAYVFIVMAFINIILSIILSYFFGALGASLSICISYFIRSAGMNIIYYKSLEINIIEYFRECHIKMFIPLLLTLVVGIFINYLFINSNWTIFMVKGTLLVITYLIIMWILGFNEYEKNLIKSIIKTPDMF